MERHLKRHALGPKKVKDFSQDYYYCYIANYNYYLILLQSAGKRHELK